MESPSYEVMQLDFEVDNVITLAPTQTLHWSVEYASGAPASAERVSHLYVSNADIQGIVPLAQVNFPSLSTWLLIFQTYSFVLLFLFYTD